MINLIWGGKIMKKLIIVLILFVLCIGVVDAKRRDMVKVSNVKYKTYDANGNVQEGNLKFKTTYIYDIKEI